MVMALAIIFDVLILVYFGSKVEIGYIIIDNLSKWIEAVSKAGKKVPPCRRDKKPFYQRDRKRAA